MQYKAAHGRKGNVLVLTVFALLCVMGMTALSVDVGYLHNSQAELQRAADAGALAACWELGQQYAEGKSPTQMMANVRSLAAGISGSNDICNTLPSIDAAGDIEFGYIGDFTVPNPTLDTSNPAWFNTVRVRVRKDTSLNGSVQTFFARALGIYGVDVTAETTASIVRDIKGFENPGSGENIDILPFALDLDTWNDLVNGSGSDNYSWNKNSKQVTSGSDSILEVNLYPQDTGMPGNRGTVDIGGSNNSTNDIARQILHGISAQDFQDLGKPLVFDANGELELNGDTGISAGVKDELAAIIGETRIIPIYSNVQGPGNNADYTIVKWVGIRILDVKLTGPKKKKHLTVQPAAVATRGVIVGTPTQNTSSYVYSRAFIVD